MDWTHMVLAILVVSQAIVSAISIAMLAREVSYVAAIAERILNKVE